MVLQEQQPYKFQRILLSKNTSCTKPHFFFLLVAQPKRNIEQDQIFQWLLRAVRDLQSVALLCVSRAGLSGHSHSSLGTPSLPKAAPQSQGELSCHTLTPGALRYFSAAHPSQHSRDDLKELSSKWMERKGISCWNSAPFGFYCSSCHACRAVREHSNKTCL